MGLKTNINIFSLNDTPLLQDKEGGGGDTTSFLKPKRSLDANILQLKLQHPITS